MSRYDATIQRWAAYITVILLALTALPEPAYGQSTLIVPGKLTVQDDANIYDDIVVDNITSSAAVSALDFSAPTLKQPVLIFFRENAEQGKAYPDTLTKLARRTWFHAPMKGTLSKVYFSLETMNAGWDSAKVAVFGGADGDSTLFTTEPMLIPGDGDNAVTLNDGRDAVMNNLAVLAKGERVTIAAEVFGSKVTPPDGLVVCGWFYPDY